MNATASAFFYTHLNTPPSITMNYWGHQVLSDSTTRFLPSFITIYCYYLSNHYLSSNAYVSYTASAAYADSLYWQNAAPAANAARGVWGSGAGAYPSAYPSNRNDPYGYHACAIEDNGALVYSAPMMAGFLPVLAASSSPSKASTIDRLLSWRDEGDACRYTIPSTTRMVEESGVDNHTVLWRSSVRYPDWRPPTIEAVDYAPFILGLASEVLGIGFFQSHAASLTPPSPPPPPPPHMPTPSLRRRRRHCRRRRRHFRAGGDCLRVGHQHTHHHGNWWRSSITGVCVRGGLHSLAAERCGQGRSEPSEKGPQAVQEGGGASRQG